MCTIEAMTTSERTQRADVRRNRAALVRAAVQEFGRRGLDAPLDAIASAAGVGNATLYRHFPTRRDLVQAVFAEEMAGYAAAVERALAEPDPWTGLRGYLAEICALQAENRALADLVISAEYPDETRPAVVEHLRRLLDRARTAGTLRADFTVEDVALFLMANAGVVRHVDGPAPVASARLVALLLDGLAAEAATPAPPPPDRAAVARALSGRTTPQGRGEEP